MAQKVEYEEKLRSRHVVARAFALGQLGYFQEARAAEALGISPKTLKRDIARAKIHQEFDDWRPKQRGPPPGERRVLPAVMAEIETIVYAAGDQKLNVSKLGRDIELLLPGMGFSAVDIPSQSTIERIVVDMIAADPAHFAERRYGRHGKAAHSLQHGSLVTTRPLEIVCIDHTPLDARTFLIEGQSIVLRPTFTAAVDLFTSCCLAAFVSAFPPCAITVSLAMALMAVPKTDLLRAYGLPGEWEAGGLPEVLYVDGAAELTSDAVDRGCRINGIEPRVGWPGRPERRAQIERFWRTTSSEIHSWPSTTLSNPQELEAHGGQKPPAWTFDIVQRQVLALIMTHINETYGSDQIPPIMRWREAAGTARIARMTPRDPEKTFRDFLPSKERCKVNFQGIKLFNCQYRSGDLEKLRYEGVQHVEVVFDPRDVSRIWVVHQKKYVEIPRAYPKSAPKELRALNEYFAVRRAVAREKRDTALLQKLAEVRSDPFRRMLLDVDHEQLPSPDDNSLKANMQRAAWGPPTPETSSPSDEPQPPTTSPDGDGLPPNFTIPKFDPRVR